MCVRHARLLSSGLICLLEKENQSRPTGYIVRSGLVFMESRGIPSTWLELFGRNTMVQTLCSGRNKLANLEMKAAEFAGKCHQLLSKKTMAQVRGNAGFSAEDIMDKTGHKNPASILNYSHISSTRPSEEYRQYSVRHYHQQLHRAFRLALAHFTTHGA